MLTTEQYDELVHKVPQQWAAGILKRTETTFAWKVLHIYKTTIPFEKIKIKFALGTFK